MHKEFLDTDQRPFPIPRTPWMMTQTWNDILFCHWPISKEIIKQHVPTHLKLDCYDGCGWLGYVLFRVSDMKLRLCPEVLYFNSYIGFNVRTYVTYRGTPGIYFFNLDASKLYAVLGAKMATFLPLRKSSMKLKHVDEGFYFKGATRKASKELEKFSVNYQPTSEPFLLSPNSLEFWLYERYCFFVEKNKNMYRGDIHHDQWRVCSTNVDIHSNSMASFLPRHFFKEHPLVHFSQKRQAFAWSLKKML